MISESFSEYTWAERTWYNSSYNVWISRKKKWPTNKGLLVRVKCKQKSARTSAILSVFPTPCESVSLQKACYVADSITFQSLPDFLPGESRLRPASWHFPPLEVPSKTRLLQLALLLLLLLLLLLQFNGVFTKEREEKKIAITIICKRVSWPHIKTNHLIYIIKITLNWLKAVIIFTILLQI